MPDYRSHFADFGETTYLNCAYQGVLPLAAAARVHEAIDQKCHPERMDPAEYFDLPRRVRNHLAAIVGGDEREIALTSGATQGIGVLAGGLQLAPGDEVVVAGDNFPANLFTWLHMRRRGVHVRVLRNDDGPLRADDVAAAFTDKTRILALDWVNYSTGRRIDLAVMGELARKRGALFVVDGTQAVGALDLNVHSLPVDVLAVAAYKWLLGPYGTGFVYIREDVLDRLELNVVNWMSVDGAEDFDALPVDNYKLAEAARIFDVPETANFLNLSAMEASLEFIRGVGVGSVTAHCTQLLDRAAEGLQARGHFLTNDNRLHLPSPLLCFRCGTDEATNKLYSELKADHVEVSLRHHRIRVSPYLYNDKEDIDRLLQIAG
ncbi:MAG: aminotransferase class V-fold PLP-dependent enzyme [Acidobacteria bacterium]|nr:MAG: aminotransferase class V-fold PLP-dependent enzyme [Acidobacteriota bacterium]